jgi:hypothetical protein
MWQTLVKIMPDPSKETTLESIIPKVGKSSVLDRKLLRIVSTLSAFVHGTNQVLGNLASILQDSDDDGVCRLTDEVNGVNEFATDMLDKLSIRFPKRLVLVKTIKAAEFLLRLERELIRVNTERGLIQHAVAEQVQEIIERTMKRLNQSPFAFITEVQGSLNGRESARIDEAVLESVEVEASGTEDRALSRRRSRMRVNEFNLMNVEESS